MYFNKINYKIIKLFQSLKATKKLPCLVFEDTEDNAYKSFCAVVNKLSQDQENMYSIRDTIAGSTHLNQAINEYNESNAVDFAKYDAESKKKGKQTSNVTTNQYYTTRNTAIERIQTIISKEILNILIKIISMPGNV